MSNPSSIDPGRSWGSRHHRHDAPARTLIIRMLLQPWNPNRCNVISYYPIGSLKSVYH